VSGDHEMTAGELAKDVAWCVRNSPFLWHRDDHGVRSYVLSYIPAAREEWAGAELGLSPTPEAYQLVLPAHIAAKCQSRDEAAIILVRIARTGPSLARRASTGGKS
jgi:hypothetical protein